MAFIFETSPLCPIYFGAILYRNPATMAKRMFGTHKAMPGGRKSV